MRKSPSTSAAERGVALVLVLAFVVLLTGLVVAFFSQTLVQRQISNTSANQSKVEAFGRGAVETIIADLKQEIVAGSRAVTTTGDTIYFSKPAASGSPATVTPALVGSTGTGGYENLVKRSASGLPFYSGGNYDTSNYPAPDRASGVSTLKASANGRVISPARWNKALLLRKEDPASSTDFTPEGATSTTWTEAPDWILVARDGSNPKTWNTNLIATSGAATAVTARYAYNIYDEGGLLDLNFAGYPSRLAVDKAAHKDALGLADIRQLPELSGLTVTQQRGLADALVGWRQYASMQPANNFPSYFISAGNAPKFVTLIRQDTGGFLQTTNTSLFNGQSDQRFVSRQQLLQLFDTLADRNVAPKVNLQNSLQYFGTFSRDINQPTFVPAVHDANVEDPPVVLPADRGGNNAQGGDKLINPNFPLVRVQTSFTRNDGSEAKVGDPLVNKRFALQRLSWITYKGPSASRSQTDADIQSLINNGIPWAYLQQGTATNIEKYFGLTWDPANNRWKYDLHRGINSGGERIIKLVGRTDSSTTANTAIYVQDSNRDPDFFELLKAGITAGSLGKASAISNTSVNASLLGGNAIPVGYSDWEVPVNLRYNFDSSVDYHVIQIGANILSEVNPTSYPVRIGFDDGSARGLWEFQGVTDLPYLSYVFNGVLRTQNSTPPVPATGPADNNPFQYPTARPGSVTTAGNAYAIQVPAVWNPYDPNGTQGVLRPNKFRIVVDSNDPVSLANGGPYHSVWCAGHASPRPTQGGSSNEGLYGPWSPGGVSSYSATTGATSTAGVQISDAVTFDDSNGSLYREPTLIFRGSVGNAIRTGTPGPYITSIDADPLPGATDPAGTQFAPLVLGQFPLAFMYSSTTVNGVNYNTTANPVMFSGTAVIGPGGVTNDNRVYLTYSLQYEYPAGSGTYITYDRKYGRTTHGLFSFQARYNDANAILRPSVIHGPNPFSPYSWAAAIDPRTARFGLMMQIVNDQRSGAWLNQPPPFNGWVFNSAGTAAILQGITYPIRPDNLAGFMFSNLDYNDQVNVTPLNGNVKTGNLLAATSMLDVPFPSFSAGWTRPIAVRGGWANVPIFPPGMYVQNNPNVPFYWGRFTGLDTYSGTDVQPAYYADADGVVRRAAGAYVPVGNTTSASTPVGLPTASINGYTGAPQTTVNPTTTPASAIPFTQSQSRPLLLHRPFRNVAELGYVFRDVPWKNLDFFTPESGDAGLLDLFCVNETDDMNGLVAGRVNLNTRQIPVLAAIISGACVDDPKLINTTVGSLSTTAASSIANALANRTADATDYGPLQNISELVGKWKEAVGISSGVTYTPSVPSASSGIDLTLADGYKDGKRSYVGFSGSSTTSSPAMDLSSAYSTATFSSNAAHNTKLRQAVNQIQRFHEAPIRALANVGQTRVWNLMIDVVAQTGRYPQTANGLEKFMVEGEQRYWVHLAIDRLTGKVIDKQIEVVKE